jgi:hypothetical protein
MSYKFLTHLPMRSNVHPGRTSSHVPLGNLKANYFSHPSFKNLAETSHPHPPPPDSRTMITQALSPVATRTTALTQAVQQRDASSSPGVAVKARVVLPRLPVPPLRSTLDKYLQSIKPLLLQDDLRGVSAFDPAYQRRVQWAKEFEIGIGTTLQARLAGTRCFPSTLAVPVLSHLIHNGL